jgi:hypothetical protein
MSHPTSVPGQDSGALDEDIFGPEQLVLSDLINRVLDKGVVISAHVTISIAEIDLIQLDLRLLVSSVATRDERGHHVPVRSRSGA